MNDKTLRLARGALIAALYVAVTTAFAPISFSSNSPFQLRISEALTFLPLLTFDAVPGLFVGCMLANGIGVAMGQTVLIDVAVGSIATLIAAYATYRLRRIPWLAMLSPVVVNALIVGAELHFAYGYPLAAATLWVALGELAMCAVALLLYYLMRRLSIWE